MQIGAVIKYDPLYETCGKIRTHFCVQGMPVINRRENHIRVQSNPENCFPFHPDPGVLTYVHKASDSSWGN